MYGLSRVKHRYVWFIWSFKLIPNQIGVWLYSYTLHIVRAIIMLKNCAMKRNYHKMTFYNETVAAKVRFKVGFEQNVHFPLSFIR